MTQISAYEFIRKLVRDGKDFNVIWMHSIRNGYVMWVTFDWMNGYEKYFVENGVDAILTKGRHTLYWSVKFLWDAQMKDFVHNGNGLLLIDPEITPLHNAVLRC